MENILIVKTSAIGDVIQTLPVLEYLRHKFPTAQIDWAVEKGSAGLLKSHPFLRRILIADTKAWRQALLRKATWQAMRAFRRDLTALEYDLVVDLQGNTKSALITALARAKTKVGFGLRTVAEKPNLLATDQRYEVSRQIDVRLRYLRLIQLHLNDQEAFVSTGATLKIDADERKRLHELLAHPCLESRPRWMVAFGSNWENKRLKEATLKQFLTMLSEVWQPAFIFIWGNAQERELAVELQNLFPHKSLAVGHLSLPLWQALMGQVDALIAMDSAALHLCATTRTPSFSVFGPSLATVFKPHGAQHYALQGACPYGRVFKERCPVLRTCPTGACIRELSAETLFEAFRNWQQDLILRRV